MPVVELSKEKISENLLYNGVPDTSVSELIEILDACEFARYAPSAAGQAMATDYEKAIEVISSIDSSMKSKRRISGKYTAVIILMCCFTSASAAAESDPDYLWNAACESYEQGNYAEAASYYEAVSDMGLESPALYYNTANAYFQQGKLAKAILYYERALKLDPSYDDAKYNLDHANTLIQDKIDSVPEFFLKEWLRSISDMMDSDSWAVTFLVLLGITLVLLLTYLTARSVAWRRTGFYVGILTLLLMFCALSFSLWQKSDYEDSDKAIVMRDLEVRSTPSEDASMKVLFELHPGTKVNVLEIKGSSMKISIADGRQGWVNTYDMDVI
jgi:tetratricopeptide (TPR) repeat protein